MPLLRRLQLEPWTSGASSLEDDEDHRTTHQYLLQDLHRLEAVAEALADKERAQLRAWNALRDAVLLATEPLKMVLRILLHRAVSLDPNGYFALPVPLEDVPDYLDFVQTPMDFSSMAVKLEANEYEKRPIHQ